MNKRAETNRRGVKAHRMRRLAWLNAIKLDSGCLDCGYDRYPEALDFDHLPGCEKVSSITKMVSGSSMERLLAEMAKCEIVCANCHRHRTALRAR